MVDKDAIDRWQRERADLARAIAEGESAKVYAERWGMRTETAAKHMREAKAKMTAKACEGRPLNEDAVEVVEGVLKTLFGRGAYGIRYEHARIIVAALADSEVDGARAAFSDELKAVFTQGEDGPITVGYVNARTGVFRPV